MASVEGMRDLIIIGGGPAGLAAAIYGSRSGLKTLVLERQMTGGQVAMTDLIENYPGFPEGISGFELVEKMKKQALRFGAEIREVEAVEGFKSGDAKEIQNYPGFPEGISGFELVEKMKKQALRFGAEIREVEAVEGFKSGDAKEIQTSDSTFTARSVIIATGVDPMGLDCVGEKKFRGRGVSYCATCDGAFFKDKTVAVVGGGNSAVEEALYLTRFAQKVFIVHRRDELRADHVYRKRVEADPSIEILWTSQLREIRGQDKVESMYVEFTDKGEFRDIKVDGVFFY